MKTNSKIALFVIIGLILFSGLNYCKKKPGPQKISDKKFVQIYCDVTCYSDIIDKKLRKALVDSVLKSYSVTHESFEYSKKLFSKDPKRWKEIFEKIVNELEQRKKDIESKSDSSTVIINHKKKQRAK